MRRRTRFAPSPTGHLHVGNAYSALICQRWAEEHDAELVLRIEDIDHTRCRPRFEQAIREDLAWLGVRWRGEVWRQSERLTRYREALEHLREMGVIYPCFCTRRAIREEIARMGRAPHAGEESAYPGICRNVAPHLRRARMRREPYAWRLDTAAAEQRIGGAISWRDADGRSHEARLASRGDTVIGRKDIGVSYHLAVVVDDAAQGITHVVRGRDLIDSTGIHRALQALLGLPDPVYLHHPLLTDEAGERLAKRHGAPTLHELRGRGVDPERLRSYLLDGDHVWPERLPASLLQAGRC